MSHGKVKSLVSVQFYCTLEQLKVLRALKFEAMEFNATNNFGGAAWLTGISVCVGGLIQFTYTESREALKRGMFCLPNPNVDEIK
jgi:hypothetical protein